MKTEATTDQSNSNFSAHEQITGPDTWNRERLNTGQRSSLSSFARRWIAGVHGATTLAVALSSAIPQKAFADFTSASLPQPDVGALVSNRDPSARPELRAIGQLKIGPNDLTPEQSSASRVVYVHRSSSDELPGVYFHEPVFNLLTHDQKANTPHPTIHKIVTLPDGRSGLFFAAQLSSPAIRAEARSLVFTNDAERIKRLNIPESSVKVFQYPVTDGIVQAIDRYSGSVFGVSQTKSLRESDIASFTFNMTPEVRDSFVRALGENRVDFVWHFSSKAVRAETGKLNMTMTQEVEEKAVGGLHADQRSGAKGLTQIEKEKFLRDVEQNISTQIIVTHPTLLTAIYNLIRTEASTDRFFIAEQTEEWRSLTPDQQRAVAEHMRPLIESKLISQAKHSSTTDTDTTKKTTHGEASGGGGVNLGVVKFGGQAGVEFTKQELDTIEKTTGVTLRKDKSTQSYVPTGIKMHKLNQSALRSTLRQIAEIVMIQGNVGYQETSPISTEFTDAVIKAWSSFEASQKRHAEENQRLTKENEALLSQNKALAEQSAKLILEAERMKLREETLQKYYNESRRYSAASKMKVAPSRITDYSNSDATLQRTVNVEGKTYKIERPVGLIQVERKGNSYLFELDVRKGDTLLMQIEGKLSPAEKAKIVYDLKRSKGKKPDPVIERELRHNEVWTAPDHYSGMGDSLYLSPRAGGSEAFVTIYVVTPVTNEVANLAKK